MHVQVLRDLERCSMRRISGDHLNWSLAFDNENDPNLWCEF